MPWSDGTGGGSGPTPPATNTNDVQVSGNYVPIDNAIVSAGTSTTVALGALQGQLNAERGEANAIRVNTNMNVNYDDLKQDISVSYVNTGSSVITLTLVNGGSFINYPILNGSATTAGLNPMEVLTLTKQSDNLILCS